MPVYEYSCAKCKAGFSLMQRLGATEKDTICPYCGSREVKKLVSSFSCSIGGGGFGSGFSGGT